MVIAKCFHRRAVTCKWTGAGSGPPHPAPSADGLKKTPAAVHPLPEGGEGRRIIARLRADSGGLETEGRGNVLPPAAVPAKRLGIADLTF